MPTTRLFAFSIAAASVALVACSSSNASGPTTDGGGDSFIVHAPKNHRPSPTTCAPSKSGTGTCGAGSPPLGICHKDSDCTSGTNGHCILSGGGVAICSRFYDTCVPDADCSTGGPCACQGTLYQDDANACAGGGNCKV